MARRRHLSQAPDFTEITFDASWGDSTGIKGGEALIEFDARSARDYPDSPLLVFIKFVPEIFDEPETWWAMGIPDQMMRAVMNSRGTGGDVFLPWKGPFAAMIEPQVEYSAGGGDWKLDAGQLHLKNAKSRLSVWLDEVLAFSGAN